MVIKYILPLILITAFGCKKPVTAPNDDQGVKRNFTWSVDTLVFNEPGYVPADQISMYSIWGSSPKNVYAAGHSDVPWTRLWHYDGKKWSADREWTISGIDTKGNSYIVYPINVYGLNAQNIFVACSRYYDDLPDSVMVLKWNGSAWSEVPWINNKRSVGGANWIVSQNNQKLWISTFSNKLIKYENGFLSEEPVFTDYQDFNAQIAALDNGFVYVNARKDSIVGENLLGSITRLYQRDLSGKWDLIIDKYIPGSYEDGNGFGIGLVSVGNRMFTANRGIWEKIGNSWQQILSLQGFGGECLVSENNIWFYFNHEVWHWNGKDWAYIDIPILKNYPMSYLYGRGWSDGNEIFLSLHYNGKTLILHGK